MTKSSLICVGLLLCCFNSMRCQNVSFGEANSSQPGHSRIVGGKPASTGQWPWQAAVYLITSSSVSFVCGGVLIGPGWVVSAAHCFHGSDERTILVLFGVYDLRYTSSTEQSRHVNRYINHPSYDSSTFFADLSLLELETAVVYDDYVQPAILPSSTTSIKSGQLCVVSGYGETEGTGEKLVLNYAEVQIISLETCKLWYLQSSIPVPDDHVCAGYEAGGVDSCQGDSGGPLVCANSSVTSAEYFLLGITSFGQGCALQRRPGAYTNIINYLDWIMEYDATTATAAPNSQRTISGSEGRIVCSYLVLLAFSLLP